MIHFFVYQLTDMASDTDLIKELNYKFSWLKVIIPVSRKLIREWEGDQMCLWSKQ